MHFRTDWAIMREQQIDRVEGLDNCLTLVSNRNLVVLGKHFRLKISGNTDFDRV